MSAPRASIIIPTFNRLDMTTRCLAALRKNTDPKLADLIVVDNGSSDGTTTFLREQQQAGRLRTQLNQENVGFARACNQGAALAATPTLVMLNNDTEPEPGWLEPLLAALDGDPRVAAVGAKLLYPDRTIQHGGVALVDHRPRRDPLLALHLFVSLPEDHPSASRPRPARAVTAACMAIRRNAFEAVGGFDEGYWNGYEDVDLCLEFAAHGWTIQYEPRSVVIHHESQSGPERFRRAQQNVARLHAKWLGKAAVDAVIGD